MAYPSPLTVVATKGDDQRTLTVRVFSSCYVNGSVRTGYIAECPHLNRRSSPCHSARIAINSMMQDAGYEVRSIINHSL